MPDLFRTLRHRRDYMDATASESGLRVLTNVSFDGDAPEAIRLNLDSPNSSLRRSLERVRFPKSDPPFEIHSPSALLSSDELGCLQTNFAIAHDALGGDCRLGSVSIESPIHEQILPRIQARSLEIQWINSILQTLSLDSALLRAYSNKPQSIDLFHGNQPTEQAVRLLENLASASELYSQLPELRAYADQDDVQAENIGPRGEQFRLWLQENHTITDGGDTALDYVAYAPRPLRIRGCNWNLAAAGELPPHIAAPPDVRRMTVDLLLRFEGYPVWFEVKAKGDKWASSALQQILLYGAMLSGPNQKHRCRRYFADQFLTYAPWLGVLVEEQDDPRILTDFEMSLSFGRSPEFQRALCDLFGGFVFGMMKETLTGWTLSRVEIIRW